MTARRTLRRIHVWLGWVVGVPILFWTLSGLWMAARPIAEVRGTALRAEPPALVLPATVTPPRAKAPIRSLTIEQRLAGPVWVAKFADGRAAHAGLDGRWLPPLDRTQAIAIARAAYAPTSSITSAAYTAADAPPLDLRQPRPAWGVTFADGAHLFVDADTGAVLAVRTAQWRAYDWMWGLHIMDLGGREATHHAVLVGFAALATLTALLAIVLLPLSSRRRRGER